MAAVGDKTIIFSILEYLNELSKEQAAGKLSEFADLDAESLSVAIDCLSSTFGIDTSNAEHKQQYAQEPKLRAIFNAQAGSVSNPTVVDDEEEKDPKFESFLQLLSKRDYFKGVEPGSEAYQARLKEARARYEKATQQKAESTPSTAPKQCPAQQLPSGTAESWKVRGNEYLTSTPPQPKEAVEAYSNAILLDDTNAIFFANRAAAHLILKDFQSAVTDCKRAIEIQPSYIKSYARLGQAYEGLGDNERAVSEAYEPALALEPDNATFKAKVQTLRAPNPFAVADDQEPSGGGMPDLSGLKGMFPGGMPDIGALLSDPAKMQALMENPMIANLMKNPQMAQMAQQMMQNPDLMKGMFGGKQQ